MTMTTFIKTNIQISVKGVFWLVLKLIATNAMQHTFDKVLTPSSGAERKCILIASLIYVCIKIKN